MDSINENKTGRYGTIIAILAMLLVLETTYLIISRGKRSRMNYESAPATASSKTHSVQKSQKRMPKPAWDDSLNDPFELLESMQDRMNRLFNSALRYSSAMPVAAMGLDSNFDFSPAIDLQEKDNAYVVKSDLPGLEKDKINITVRGNLLTIQGARESKSESKDAQGGYYAQERSYGSFARSVTLPGPVDEANVKADYKDGVLTIILPKTKDEKSSQKIPIQ